MSREKRVRASLQGGDNVIMTVPQGHWEPPLEEGSEVTLTPLPAGTKIRVGDVLLVRIKGRDFLGYVLAKRRDQFLMGDAKTSRGWVREPALYGRVLMS